MNDRPNPEPGRAEPGRAEPQLGIRKAAELGLGTPSEIDTPGKGRYKRASLPHIDAPHTCQFVTFRLSDSLPRDKLRALEREIAGQPRERQDHERRKRIEQWLDAGMGCCALRHPDVARIMQDTLQRFDGERYRLIAWCIMPNHVHVLIETTAPLAKIVQSWKSFTGRWVLSHWAELGLGTPGVGTPGKPGAFWMRDYWDRYIRNERHLHAAMRYIHENPVKARLCAQAAEWSWSSAAADLDSQPPSGC